MGQAESVQLEVFKNDGGNQVAADDKENINTNKSAPDPLEASMKKMTGMTASARKPSISFL